MKKQAAIYARVSTGEQPMIQEGLKAGLARARVLGKAFGRLRVPASTEQAIEEARQQGKGIKKIAR